MIDILNTYRYLEHCGPFNDDDLNYRSKKEINLWKSKCPIKYYTKKLINRGYLQNNEVKNWNIKIQTEIDKSFKDTYNSKSFPIK